VLAAQHLLRLARVDFLTQFIERPREVVADSLARLRPFDEYREVVDTARERLAERAIVLEAAPPLQQLLRRRLVLPEVRLGDFLLYLREFFGGT
jgi:hypothetical protein